MGNWRASLNCYHNSPRLLSELGAIPCNAVEHVPVSWKSAQGRPFYPCGSPRVCRGSEWHLGKYRKLRSVKSACTVRHEVHLSQFCDADSSFGLFSVLNSIWLDGSVAASALSASCTGVLSEQNEPRQCCHLALGDVSWSLWLRTVVQKQNRSL